MAKRTNRVVWGLVARDRLLCVLLGGIVGAVAGVIPVGYLLGIFRPTDFRECSLVGGVVGAIGGALFGPWFVSATFAGIIGAIIGGLSGLALLWGRFRVSGEAAHYEYLGAFWMLCGAVGGCVVGVLVGLWLVARVRSAQRR